MRGVDGIIDSVDVNLSKLQEVVKGGLAGCKESNTAEQLSSNSAHLKALLLD